MNKVAKFEGILGERLGLIDMAKQFIELTTHDKHPISSAPRRPRQKGREYWKIKTTMCFS